MSSQYFVRHIISVTWATLLTFLLTTESQQKFSKEKIALYTFFEYDVNLSNVWCLSGTSCHCYRSPKKNHHSRKSRIPIKLNHLHFLMFYVHIYIFLKTYVYTFNNILSQSAILFKQFEVFHWISTCYLNAITEDIDISLIHFLSNSKYISFLKLYTQI